MFKINGEEWRVLIVSPFHPALRRSDGNYSLGVCDDLAKTIFITEDLNQKYLWKVLSHELTHAAMFSYNIDLSLEQEELVADLIATYGEEINEITNQTIKKIKGAYFE